MSTEGPVSAWFGALRRTADDLAGMVRDRVALVAVELQEEKTRAVQCLVWLAASVVAGLLALMSVSALIVVALWDVARLAALAALAGVYAALCIGCAWALRRRLVKAPRPFAATLAEIDADRTCLRKES